MCIYEVFYTVIPFNQDKINSDSKENKKRTKS